MSNIERSFCDDHHQNNYHPVPNCGALDCRITHVDVFLGSLTFTAEQLAFSLAEKAKLHGVVTTVRSLDDFQPEQYFYSTSSHRVVVFVVSTHAAGKPSPNSEKFLQWLRKASTPFCSPTTGPLQLQVNRNDKTTNKLTSELISAGKPLKINDPSLQTRQISVNVPTRPQSQDERPNFHSKWRRPFGRANSSKTMIRADESVILHGFHYAVFGIGNSVDRSFNATATYMDTRLQELGAVNFCPLGLGDMSKSVETMFERWETRLLQLIAQSGRHSTCTQLSSEDPSRMLSLHKETHVISTTCIDKPRNGILVRDVAKSGPTVADLELPFDVESQGNGRQRRHSSATTMIVRRRAKIKVNTALNAIPQKVE